MPDQRTVYKVSFETVSAIAHPEYYGNERPIVRPDQVPEEHWHAVERVGSDVHGQYLGLRELAAEGELIRNVQLFEGEAADVVWREVTL